MPDSLFFALKRRAKAKEQTVAEVIRRGVERELESMADETHEPTFEVFDLGVPQAPVSEWRDLANDRGL